MVVGARVPPLVPEDVQDGDGDRLGGYSVVLRDFMFFESRMGEVARISTQLLGGKHAT